MGGLDHNEGALQHPLHGQPCPSLDADRPNQVLKVMLFQQWGRREGSKTLRIVLGGSDRLLTPLDACAHNAISQLLVLRRAGTTLGRAVVRALRLQRKPLREGAPGSQGLKA